MCSVTSSAPNGTARFGHRGKLAGKVVAKDVLFSLDGEAIGRQMPIIVQGPSDLTVQQGDPAEFTAVATGEALNYQWRIAVSKAVPSAADHCRSF